jgi:hypothetical protein
LVPLMPKEEMPARRGCPFAGQSTGSLSKATLPAVQSTCDEGVSTCKVLGNC